MPHTFHPQDKRQSAPSFHKLWQPVESVFIDMPPLEVRGNRPLQLNFEHQLKSFVCRIRENSTKICIRLSAVKPGGIVFYDAIVLLGTPGVNQTEKELRVIGYRIDNKIYWIATNRYDLSAEELTTIYKLRWNIEIFFGWWKRHLKVYHLIARTKRGLLTQILSGLITYLLLAIYCHEQYQEKVSMKRVRELRIKIQNETRNLKNNQSTPTCQQVGLWNLKEQQSCSYAIP